MNDNTASSIYVTLLFILRCLVPVAILFGISYLLRRMGLVASEETEPPEQPLEEPHPAKAMTKKSVRSRKQPARKTPMRSKRSRIK